MVMVQYNAGVGTRVGGAGVGAHVGGVGGGVGAGTGVGVLTHDAFLVGSATHVEPSYPSHTAVMRLGVAALSIALMSMTVEEPSSLPMFHLPDFRV